MNGFDEHDATDQQVESGTDRPPAAAPLPPPPRSQPATTAPSSLPRRAIQGLLAGAWGEHGESDQLGTRVAAVLWGLLLAVGWWLVFKSQPFDKDWSGLFSATPVGKGIALLLVLVGFCVGGAVIQACRTNGYGVMVNLAALEGLVVGGMLAQATWRFGPVWFLAMALSPFIAAGCLYLLAAGITRRERAAFSRLGIGVLGVAVLGLGCWFGPSAISGPLTNACRPASPLYTVFGRLLDPTSSTSVSRLGSLLHSTDPEMAARAATRLGELADPGAIESLHEAALNENPKLSMAAVTALGHIPDPKALDTLLSLHSEQSFRGISALEPAIAMVAPHFADRALSDLQSDDVYVRRRAMAVIHYTLGPQHLDALIGALGDSDGVIRSSAAACLGKLGDRRAVEPLMAAARRTDVTVPPDVLSALVQLGDPRSLPIVAEIAEKGGASSEVVRALGHMPSTRAAQALVHCLLAQGLRDDAGASDALRNMKPDARAPLLAAAVCPDATARRVAIAAIRDFYPDDHEAQAVANRGAAILDASTLATQLEEARMYKRVRAEVLLNVYRDANPALMALADNNLGKSFNPQDRDVFVRALKDSNDRVRLAAVKALAAEPDLASNADELIGVLRDGNAKVRHAALQGLISRKVQPEAYHVPALREVLQHDPDPHMRALAAQALGRTEDWGRHDDPANAALKQAQNDSDASVRQAAQEALARR